MKFALRISIILLLSCAAFSQTTKIRSVTSLPATCAPGDGVNPADIVALASGGTTSFEICRVTNTWEPLVPDPGSNGVIFRSALNTTRVSTSTDIISLWTGSCNANTVLFGDGSCGNSGVQTPACPGLLPMAYFPNGSTASIQGDCLFTTDGNGNVSLKSITGSGTGTTVYTGTSGTAPSVPGGASQFSLFVDSGTSTLNCLLHSGASCLPASAVTSVFGRTGAVLAVANDYTFDKIGAGSNLNVLSMGNAGSLKPLNLGQVVGNQLWLQPTITSTVIDSSNSGGSIGSAQVQVWQYTLNSALGETLPNKLQNTINGTAGCVSGSSCSFTMHVPTIPSGYTGYTAYWCDLSGGSGCTAPVKILACANILTTCVMTNPGLNSGVALPTVDTAVVTPPNLQATECPPGVIPSMFSPDASGNYHTWGGMLFDSNQIVPRTTGTPVICHSTFFTDQMVNPVVGNNAFVVIDHNTGVNTDVINNQDRALWVGMTNPASDTSQHYSITGLQGETDVQGAPTWTAAIDGEIAMASFQVGDTTTGVGMGAPNGGVHTMRANYFKNGAGNFGAYQTLDAQFNVGNNAFTAGSTASILQSTCKVTGTASNLSCIGYRWIPAAGTLVSQYGMWQSGSIPPGTGNMLIRNDAAGENSNLNGIVALSGIYNSGPSAALPVNGSVSLQPSLTINQGAITGPNSPTCSGGASTYSYQFVGVDNNGGVVVSSTGSTGASCTNPLTSGNPVNVNVSNNTATEAQFAQFVRIDVYRTAGPMATGKIGSLTCSAPSNFVGVSCSTFSDTGLAATTAVPTVNTTGGATIGGDFTLGTSKGQHINTQAANNDFAGTCTASAATTCTVTFTRAYTSAPICVATDATNITTLKVTPATGSLIITTTGATSDVFDYICTGNPN